MYTGRHSNSASAKKLPHPFHPRNARLPTHQSDSNASGFPTNPTLQSDIDGSTFSRKLPFSISSPQFDPNAESNDDVSEPQAPPVQTKKRARGRTKMLKTWGEKATKVEINELNQAVGEAAGIMASQMGRKVKQGNLFSLLCKDWRMMDSHVKESTWEEFQANFSLEDRHKKEFLKHLGVLWKNWKHHVKENYYSAYETDAERLANCPDEIVEKAQWPKVVEYWSSEDGQRASNRNKLNRSKLRVIARTGRKSFATLRDENAETAQARPQSTTTKHVPSSSFHATQTEPFSKQHDVPVPRNDTRKQNPTRTVFPGVSKNVGWDLFTK